MKEILGSVKNSPSPYLKSRSAFESSVMFEAIDMFKETEELQRRFLPLFNNSQINESTESSPEPSKSEEMTMTG